MVKKIEIILIIGLVCLLGFLVFNCFNNQEEKVLELDLSSLNWKEATSSTPWSARDSHALTVFQDKLWLMGGLNANDHILSPNNVEYWKAPHFSDVWVSEDGITWNLVTENAAWGKKRSMRAVEFLDKMWVIAGWGPIEGLEKEVWSSIDGLNWNKEVAEAPWPAREGHELMVFQDKLWLIGGVNYDTRETFNDVWFSADGITWQMVTSSSLWSSRWDHDVVAFQDKLWLIGGMDLNDNVFSDVWFSADGITWQMATNSPPWQSRQGTEALVFKDAIWLLGRFNDDYNGGVNDVWFSKDGFNWEKTKKDPQWLGKEDLAATVFKDKIWITGGMDRNWQWQNDIWYSIFEEENESSFEVPEQEKLTAGISLVNRPQGKSIEVSLAEQKMRTFEDGKLIYEFTVSTGKEDSPTPEGNFTVLNKHVEVFSNLSSCWLPYWVGFTSDGLYGIHETPLCKEGRRGEEDLGKPASIGCVRVGMDESQIFYNWVEVGTPIKIYNGLN
jgi:hypothetical protein